MKSGEAIGSVFPRVNKLKHQTDISALFLGRKQGMILRKIMKQHDGEFGVGE